MKPAILQFYILEKAREKIMHLEGDFYDFYVMIFIDLAIVSEICPDAV